MLRLMLATGNSGKVAELRAILSNYFEAGSVMLLTPRDWPNTLPEVAETGTTFAENARLKANALTAATGLPALADDSGLCVDFLGGAPGLLSARWAGAGASDADRNAKLLHALEDVPLETRTARFVCAMALSTPGVPTITAEGVCEGIVLAAPRGENGFGYDPLFLLPDFGRTMAELSDSEKNLFSHRALAVSRLSSQIASLFNPS